MSIFLSRYNRFSRRLIYSLLALVFLAASLMLPVFEFVFLGARMWVPGWAAAFFSVEGAAEGIAALAKGESVGDKWRFFVAGVAALFNLAFLVSPFILCKKGVTRRRLIVFAVLTAAGAALGAACSLLFSGDYQHLLIGYQVWLCAYAALAVAILSAWIEDRTAWLVQ